MSDLEIPTVEQIREAGKKLGSRIRKTPVWEWKGQEVEQTFGKGTRLFLKMELFQYGGSFKVRGALMNMLHLSKEELERGVTAVSAGNHAIAVAFSAKSLNTTAKVVMPKTAIETRVERCKSFGAEVVLADDVHQAFDKVREIEKKEGRSFVHPFEGRLTALGTATAGLELTEQAGRLDAVIIPIGGGGLCAGISAAIKHLNPACEVFGVEPEGADSMSRSFASGKPEAIEKVNTIADSLGAPHAAPYSFRVCKRFVDEIVKITDAQMARTMKLLFEEMKLAVEPAGASATAALRYPLKERLSGKKAGMIVCGTNIDPEGFYSILQDYAT